MRNFLKKNRKITQDELAKTSKVSLDVIRAIEKGTTKAPGVFFLDIIKSS